MKTRADIIDELEDKYKITAESLTNRELLIIGIATRDHDSEVEKLFIPVVSQRSELKPQLNKPMWQCDECDTWFDFKETNLKCPNCGFCG